MSKKVGTRVGAFQGTDDKTRTVKLLGYGVYEGDYVVGEEDPSPVGWLGAMMVEEGLRNPRIRLDSGKVVWGCECWWEPEARAKDRIEASEAQGYSVVEVDPEEMRDRFRQDAQKDSPGAS